MSDLKIYYYSTKEKASFNKGYSQAISDVLKILKQDLYNLDLSTDSCDKRYIEKIKELK